MRDGGARLGGARRAAWATVVAAVVIGAAACLPLPPGTIPGGPTPGGSGSVVTPVAGDWTQVRAADRTPMHAVGLAVAGTTAYVVDTRGIGVANGTAVVRAVDLSSGVQRIVAGTFVKGVADAQEGRATALPFDGGAVAVDSTGRLLIGARNRLERLEPDGRLVTIGGRSPSTGGSDRGDGAPVGSALFLGISALAVGPDGLVYLYDMGRIRVVDFTGTIRTIAGGGTTAPAPGVPALAALLPDGASMVVAPTGDVVVADEGTHRVWSVGADGRLRLVAGRGTAGFAGDGGPATAAALSHPSSLAVGPDRSILIGDMGNNRIRSVSAAGTISTVAGRGGDGATTSGAAATATDLVGPWAMASTPDGRVVVADGSNQGDTARPTGKGDVWTVVVGGPISHLAGTGGHLVVDDVPAIDASLGSPGGMAIDAAGNRYLADIAYGRIYRMTPDGRMATFVGAGASELPYHFVAPAIGPIAELAVDHDGRLLVADAGAGKVRRYNPDGSSAPDLVVRAGTTTLGRPFALSVDGAGNVFVGDGQQQLVFRVATDGTTTIVAGTVDRNAPLDVGTPAQGSATASRVLLGDVTVTPGGDLYLIDHGVLRRVRDGRFEDLGDSCCPWTPSGDPDARYQRVRAAGDGTLWGIAGRSIYRIRPGGATTFVARFLPHPTLAVPLFEGELLADVLPSPDGSIDVSSFGDGRVYRVTDVAP